MSEKVKSYIKKLFTELNEEVNGIVKISPSSTKATQSIMEYVSVKIAASTQGYMADIYSEMSKKTLSEEIFQEPANANRFYELNLRKRISDAYSFDVKNVKAYDAVLDFKEINRVYASAGAAVGSATVSAILLGILSGVVDIPVSVVIAGAVLVGAGGGATTYLKVVPEKNRSNYLKSVNKFMAELENELLKWVDDVAEFYNQNVEELKANL